MALKLSGFTFVHNALEGGYPIAEAIWAVRPWVDEIVAVDMQSTDGTREILEKLGCRVVDSDWSCRDEYTLDAAFAMHRQCQGEVIVFFEADEVWDEPLIREAVRWVDTGLTSLLVYRLQVEQNFQRMRWAPDLVHRVFRWGSVTRKQYTTSGHQQAVVVPATYGYLWDVTYCFRDNVLDRAEQNARLWHETPKYRFTPYHFMARPELTRPEVEQLLQQPHWTATATPFALPDILKPLVGMTKYEVRL